ncbi:hypothetical protein EDC56_3870, partial [Sinobacterium caligoides]
RAYLLAKPLNVGLRILLNRNLVSTVISAFSPCRFEWALEAVSVTTEAKYTEVVAMVQALFTKIAK